MACCLTAQSHYINKSEVIIRCWNVFEKMQSKLRHISQVQLVNSLCQVTDLARCLQNYLLLSHRARVTHLCFSKLTIIGSDNGLLPVRCQAIISTNAGILLIRSFGTNFSELFFIKIHAFSFRKMHLKMLSAKWRLFCLDLSVFRNLAVNISFSFIASFQ